MARDQCEWHISHHPHLRLTHAVYALVLRAPVPQTFIPHIRRRATQAHGRFDVRRRACGRAACAPCASSGTSHVTSSRGMWDVRTSPPARVLIARHPRESNAGFEWDDHPAGFVVVRPPNNRERNSKQQTNAKQATRRSNNPGRNLQKKKPREPGGKRNTQHATMAGAHGGNAAFCSRRPRKSKPAAPSCAIETYQVSGSKKTKTGQRTPVFWPLAT